MLFFYPITTKYELFSIRKVGDMNSLNAIIKLPNIFLWLYLQINKP